VHPLGVGLRPSPPSPVDWNTTGCLHLLTPITPLLSDRPCPQVFDLPDTGNVSSPCPSSSASPPPFEPSTRPEKRSLSPTPGATRRKSTGERVTTKDFVPPDVSGLTKREARLVKNRAAAFLSRQRKREEFEAMEVRVKELETEAARFAAMSQQGGMSTEVEKLRAQLAEAEKREQALRSTLARQPNVKIESVDKPMASSSREASASLRNGHRLGFVPVLSGALTSYLGSDSWPQVPQFEIEPEVLDVFASLEVSYAPSSDGRGRVRIHRPLAVPVKNESRSPSSLHAWPVSGMNNFGSSFSNPMMAAHSLPTASELDRLGPFMGMGVGQQRFDVDIPSTPSFYEHPGSMGQHQLVDAGFDYDPRFYNQYTPRMCKA